MVHEFKRSISAPALGFQDTKEQERFGLLGTLFQNRRVEAFCLDNAPVFVQGNCIAQLLRQIGRCNIMRRRRISPLSHAYSGERRPASGYAILRR
jgi:hypothetical protein